MNWRFCPHCETQLDEATGICPACRWDPLAEPSPTAPEPEISLMERYRGTEYDTGYTAARLALDDRHLAGPTHKAKLALLIGVLMVFGLYGGMFAYTQMQRSEPPTPVMMSAP